MHFLCCVPVCKQQPYALFMLFLCCLPFSLKFTFTPKIYIFGCKIFDLGKSKGFLFLHLLETQGRRSRPLPLGRPVQPITSSNRLGLTAVFSQWLLETCGSSLEQALAQTPFNTEAFVEHLVSYGKDLYNSGRPYWHFSETVNAVTPLKPVLRRQCQAAWDLAYTWLSEEPSSHHIAVPAIVLVSILSSCLCWGWTKEAGIFALCFGGLLRVGEATKAKRGDLVFPSDALGSQDYVLIKIDRPKTRGRAARRQSSRVEAADLVSVISIAFEHRPRSALLWPHAGQTLRRRFDHVLQRLCIPTTRGPARSLDLGSLRPGGATYLLQVTEDSEYVRRRGRWVSHKVMEIYLQEVTACTFISDLPLDARSRPAKGDRLDSCEDTEQMLVPAVVPSDVSHVRSGANGAQLHALLEVLPS